MLWKMLILLLQYFQHSVAFNIINIVQYRSHDKRICALSLFTSNVVHNVNLIVALHLAFCGSILAVIALGIWMSR